MASNQFQLSKLSSSRASAPRESLSKGGKSAAMVMAIALCAALSPRGASAQNATRMANVQTVFSRRASGNAFFNRNLRAALQARGLRFTHDKKRADAFLDSSGNGLKNGGFAGQMTFIGRGGRVLSHETVVRPAKSRVMAFRSLAQKTRIGKP